MIICRAIFCALFIQLSSLCGQSLQRIIEDINPFDEKLTAYRGDELNQLRRDATRAYREMNYILAAKMYHYILNHDYNDYHSLYNLACCYGILERPDLAAEYLARAINAGFHDYQFISEDPDFNNVRGDPEFDEIEREIVKRKIIQGSIEYIEGKKLFKCRIKLPANYNPDKRYPMLIALHGYGSNTENFISIGSALTRPEVILVVPEAPYLYQGDSFSTEIGYSWATTSREAHVWRENDVLNKEYLLNVVAYIKKRYNITRTYLLGFSQGVAYTYYTAFNNPHLFDGIICCAGNFPGPDSKFPMFGKEDILHANNIPVYLAHGRDDPAVELAVSSRIQEILEDAGYRVNLFVFNGGHVISGDIAVRALKWFESVEESKRE